MVFYEFCKILPLRKKHLVFLDCHNKRVSGNIKFLYERAVTDYPNFNCHLIEKSDLRLKKLPFKMYYLLATSRYIFLNDYFNLFGHREKRKGVQLVQVWHAAGAFKKFAKDSLRCIEDSGKMSISAHCHSQNDVVVVSAEKIRDIYAHALSVPKERVVPLGVARADFFFDTDQQSHAISRLYSSYPELKGKKVILYAPTYRDGEQRNFKLQLDTKKVLDALGDDYVIVLKMHPYIQRSLSVNPDERHRVFNLSKENINELMVLSDYLITDYSSLCFEYALLRRPIIFFAYDYESYGEELRGFYYDYKSFIPGPLAMCNEDLIALFQRDDFDLERVGAFAEEYFQYLDGKASERILSYVLS